MSIIRVLLVYRFCSTVLAIMNLPVVHGRHVIYFQQEWRLCFIEHMLLFLTRHQ